MDQYAVVLLSFPPDLPAPESPESPTPTPHDYAAYDKAAKNHLNQLSHLLKENSADLITHGPQLLGVRPSRLSLHWLRSNEVTKLILPQLLDPAVNSLSYLAVLHTLILPGLATSASREYLLEKLTRFLLSFDSIQIRYAGGHLQDIFVAAGNGQLLPVGSSVSPPSSLRTQT